MSKRKPLTARLKDAVENLSADIFGYEKKITENIIGYLEKAGKEQGIRYEQLRACIVRYKDTVRVFLYHNSRRLKEIPVKDLVKFFAGQGADLPEIESKVVDGVVGYMDGLSRFHELPHQSLQVFIAAEGSKVVIKAFDDTRHIKDIPVKELIKYFKS
ncbi:MAG: hypothetical protein KDD04_02575 [Sinomicrobium sp.]|nr:hypothetical protein [Sinomicrobium sp.]